MSRADRTPQTPSSLHPIEDRDFRMVGVVWTVRRRGGGARRAFFTLRDLREARDRGELADDDALTCDGITWRFLGRLDNLDALFERTWDLAQQEDATSLPGIPLESEETTHVQAAPSLPRRTLVPPLGEPADALLPPPPALPVAPSAEPTALQGAGSPRALLRTLRQGSVLLLAFGVGLLIALFLGQALLMLR